MPLLATTPIVDVKEGLVEAFEQIDAVDHVLDHEPLQLPGSPAISIIFRGFRRGQLATPNVEGPIRDPLGGRDFVWRFYVRLWVAVRSDAKACQDEVDQLVPLLVRAIEADASLGGVATDSKIESGESELVRPPQGGPHFLVSCDCAVETDENV